MKHFYVTILTLLISIGAFALGECTRFLLHPDDRSACEACKSTMSLAPDYYCDCMLGSPLNYGLDTIIDGDVWFTATLAQVRANGIYGCWFADSALVMDLYFDCMLTEPTQTRVIPGNNVLSIEPEDFQEILDREGITIMDNLKIYIKASIRNRKNDGKYLTGRLIGLETSRGLDSQCDADTVFPVCFGSKVILNDNEENVYEWKYKYMTTYYRKCTSIAYKRKITSQNVRPNMEMYITEGTCDGPIIARHLFTDTVHAYFVDSAMIAQHYNSRQSLFLHFKPLPGSTGTNISRGKAVVYPNTTLQMLAEVDTAICSGAEMNLGDTILTETTIYHDTTNAEIIGKYNVTTYNLNVVSPEPIDTTLYWKDSDLNNTLFEGLRKFRTYGEHVVTIASAGDCQLVYRVNIVHDVDSVFHQIDSTICKGKTIYFQNESYTNDTTFRIGVLSTTVEDQLHVYDCHFSFQEPVVEDTTILIPRSWLPYTFRFNNQQVIFENVGTTQNLYVNGNGDCDRHLQITCQQLDGDILVLEASVDTIICKGKIFRMGGQTLDTDGQCVVESYPNPNDPTTILRTTYNVIFEQLPTSYDTIQAYALPTMYENFEITQIDQRIRKEGYDECRQYIWIHVQIVSAEPDTIILEPIHYDSLCVKTFDIQGITYQSDTVFTLCELKNDVIECQPYILTFTPLPAIDTTVIINPNTLPTKIMGIAVTAFGEYNETILTENGCEQNVHLIVKSTTSDNLTEFNDFRIYPTILDKNCTVFVEINTQGELEIIDVLGQQVQKSYIQEGRNTISLLQSGNYIFRITTTNTVYTTRIMVK